MVLAWLVAVVLIAITTIGITWACAAFSIRRHALLPFGRMAVSRKEIQRHEDMDIEPLGTLGNLIWLLFAGW